MKRYALFACLVSASYGHAQQPEYYYYYPEEYSYSPHQYNYNWGPSDPTYFDQNNYYYDNQSNVNSPTNSVKINQATTTTQPPSSPTGSQKAPNQPNQEEKSAPSKDATNNAEEKIKNQEANKKEVPDKKNGNNKEDSDKKEEDKKEDKKEEEKKEEEKPKSPHTFTANVGIVSDYRFRGISQTMRRPAIQGGFDYSHTSGIYLGTWASNVDGTTHVYNNTSMEWDLYGGYKGKICVCCEPDVTYNLGMIYYYYPGGQEKNRQHTRYNTTEFYVEIIYKWLSIKYSQTLTDYFGINSNHTPFNWSRNRADSSNGSSRGSSYIEANLTVDLCDKICYGCFQAGKLNLLLHAGHQTVRNYEHLSYTDWKATVTQEFDWFNFFVTYVGTNAKHAYYDVPDNAFHPKKRGLGVQGVLFGVIKTF
jgi:uncharacterized protein (TIGR02001 family)